MSSEDGQTATACRLIGVTKSYGDTPVLGPIDLVIHKSEKVAIIGSSGAGKTTLLKLITGEISPSSGDIELFDEPIESLALRKKSALVGLMHQQFDLVPQLSARKNIEAGNSGRWSTLRTLVGLLLPFHDVRSQTIAADLGIEAFLGERTSRLSGGQQQRVALARLLVQDPEMLLVDEPVSSLDPALSAQMLEILCSPENSGFNSTDNKTVVTNLHSPELATRYFDRIIGIANGTIEFDKTAEAVTTEDIKTVYGEPSESERLPVEQSSTAFTWGRD